MIHPLINITKAPEDKAVGAYNCVQYCFEPTDFITVTGSKAFIDIQIDNPIALNKTLNLYGQQFLFTNDTNDNGHKVAIGANETEQRDNLFDTLKTNYDIVTNFNFAKVGSDRLTITAKKNGTAYNLNFSTTSSDIQALTSTDGIDRENRKVYKLLGHLEVFRNNEWEAKDVDIVRDVYISQKNKPEVCITLQGFLSSLYKNEKPDLNSTSAYVDESGAFLCRLSIVDYKSNTGQVGSSGYFALGDPISVINGKHKKDAINRMKPYYKNLTNGFVLPLNQIPFDLELCCDNNLFLSVFVEDNENQGWSVEVYGDVHFESSYIESGHRYGGFAGIGSSVVIIPIGPTQLGICNNYLNNGKVSKYNYQAFIFSNSNAPNLFPDGDGGTFESDILDMIQLSGLTMSQTPNGYIGNGLLLEDMQNGTYTPFGTTVLTHANSIAFEKGKIYFVEAWINVSGFDCSCIENMFLDANYGTFDGVDPLNTVTVITGADTEIINGYDDQSLKISDLHLTTLSSGDSIVNGNTNIFLLSNRTYKLTAWVKVSGLICSNCSDLANIFTDGSNGNFDGPSPLSGIVALTGITTSIAAGVSSDGLELSTLDAATIVNNSRLFKGDTPIKFEAGQTYILSMDVRVENFNCASIGNLFTDGDYGTFEANINNINAPLAGTVISQVPAGRLGGNAVLLENAAPITVTINTTILQGDTPISFQGGKTYEFRGWIDLEGNALSNACADPTGLTLGIRIADILSPGDITFISSTDAVYNSSTCGTNPQWVEVVYRFSVNTSISKKVGIRVISGPSFLEPALQEIYFDDFTVVEIGAANQDIKFNIGLETPSGIETIDQQLILDNSCGSLDTWVNIQTTLLATSDFTGKASLITTGLSDLLSNPNTIIRADNVQVIGQFDEVRLQMYGLTLPSGATQSVESYLSLGSDCSKLNQWVQLETTFSTTASGNATFGLQSLRNVGCLKDENVELMIDSISLVDTQSQNLEFYITTSDGGNVLSSLKLDCDKRDQWHKIVGSYSPLADTNETVLLRVRNRTECITSGSMIVDQVRVTCREDASALITPLQTITMKGEEKCCCDDCCNEEFAYLNELGQFDFIQFDCIISQGTEVEKTTIELCTDCGDEITSDSVDVSASSRDRFTINARIFANKREQVKVFQNSLEIYRIVDGRYYPVELLTKEIDSLILDNQFVDVDLEFKYKFENPTLTF